MAATKPNQPPAATEPTTPEFRVYPLDPAALTAEQIAVTFAMTSRSPKPFDEIAAEVSAAQAADFNERWVVGYGHASVAEHAVLHLAVENISRIAADALEDHRLASYTEKSSRYQVMNADGFHIPQELENRPELRQRYIKTCQELFQVYSQLLKDLIDALRANVAPRPKESDRNYDLRLRRLATDAARSLLPAATLTNVGLTANARSLEHIISKLLSHPLQEIQELGAKLRRQGRSIAPTLIKYATASPYLADQIPKAPFKPPEPDLVIPEGPCRPEAARLIEWDLEAEIKVVAALHQRRWGGYFQATRYQLNRNTVGAHAAQEATLSAALAHIGPYDPAPREFELAQYLFELTMDYGALREYRRHRIQSLFPQPLTAHLGWRVPSLIAEARLEDQFNSAMTAATKAWRHLAINLPQLAPYLVTHGHHQRMLVQLNARECWHLFQLRTALQAHEAIREPTESMLRQVTRIHPMLFRQIQLRHYPDWWPFNNEE